jgi:hypothetical protein
MAPTHDPSIGAAAVPVYVPAPSGTPHAVIFNNTGGRVLYLGGASVTPVTGLPLYPNCKLNLPYAYTTIYAVGGFGTTGSATTFSANAAAGTATVPVTATGGYSAGNVIQLGTGTNAEALTVLSTTGTTVTFTASTSFTHLSGDAIALLSAPLGGALTVTAGTT